MKYYSVEQLQTVAADYCANLCSLRGLECCLLTEGTNGIVCPIQNYVDYLEQGKTRRF